MLRMMKVSIKSMLGGKRHRMSVTIDMKEEEQQVDNVNDIVLFKVCEQIKAEFKGSIPNGFLASMQLVSIKDI